jgi:HK97 family phage prohead protease
MPRNDYPDGAVSNAKRCLAWVEANGWGSCGTDVGKQRASQIANRENLSDETIKRTYSYLSRAAEFADVPYSEGCGGLMYDAWGGKAMLNWSRARVNEMNERMEPAVRRALRNIARAHNKENPSEKVTPLYLEITYSNLCGEPKERVQQIRKQLSGEAEEHQRKAVADGVMFRNAELRAASKPMMLEGYAALYNDVTQIGNFREMIAPGAFREVMDDDVRLLLNHDGAPLARTKNGTLKLTDDEKGLHYRAELVDTQAGRDLYTMVQRGDITQSSFGFTIGEQEISEDGTRVITLVSRLLDVSPVSFPAYVNTEVSARSEGATEKPEDIGA